MKRLTVLAFLAVAMAGCGSSSGSSSPGTTTTAATPAARRAQIAACLRKQGVNVPARRPAGATGPRPGFGFGVGGQPNPKFQDAARKCGLGAGVRGRFDSARFRQSIGSFVSCMRGNGYDMPAPNLSGSGPVFDASKVNRNDPRFQKAAQKCQGLLSFGRGATGPPPPQ